MLGLPPICDRQTVYIGADGTRWVRVYDNETVIDRYSKSDVRRGHGVPAAVRKTWDTTQGGG